MFIAIDIGNTNVTLGALKGDRPMAVVKFPTLDLRTPKKAAIAWGSQLGRVCPEAMAHAEAVYACSVVPTATSGLRPPALRLTANVIDGALEHLRLAVGKRMDAAPPSSPQVAYRDG